MTLEIAGALEITDLLWQGNGHGERVPVSRAESVTKDWAANLVTRRQWESWAGARIYARYPPNRG